MTKQPKSSTNARNQGRLTMNDEIRYTNFDSLENVMYSVLNQNGLQSGLKKATFFKFWPKIAGKKFEKYSKIVSLNERNILTVACANSAVSSELLMYKADLLKKINAYANPLGLEVEDINFSHKLWKNPSEKSDASGPKEEVKNPYEHDMTGFRPEEIDLEPDEVERIKRSVESNTFATPAQREKMFNAIILDLKAQKFIAKKNG